MLGMLISNCLSRFSLCWVPNANVVSGGKWSLDCIIFNKCSTICNIDT